ncbi:MAG: NADH-quinone oxidoreductase subunit NuoN [Hyphomonadaceae bacterium]
MTLDMVSIWATIAPELLLVVLGLAGVLVGAFLKDRFNKPSFTFGALGLFAAAALSVAYRDGGEAFHGLMASGPFVNYAKTIAYAAAGVSLLMAQGFLTRDKTIRFEYALLTIFAALGMGIILSASDLMTLYMGIETLSLSSYVLAAFHRDNLRSAEAGLKYFVLGALASGLLLYGMSLVYGFAGSTRFEEIAAADINIGIQFGMVMMISGLAFKISAAPMHVWTPDVYEGAPSPVVAFFATAPKIAAIVMVANVLFTAFGEAIFDWSMIVQIIAGASMIIGSIGALLQTNIKRLLAYSSIANVGYALIPVAAGPELGGAPLLIFMTLYVVATLGLFAGVLAMRRRGGMVEDIHELSGLIKTYPWLAISLAALIFSIAGIPPLAGFFPKLLIFEAALQADMLPLVIIMILASALSLGYYLRLVIIMFAGEPKEPFERIDSAVSMTVIITAFLSTVVFLVFFGKLVEIAEIAAALL